MADHHMSNKFTTMVEKNIHKAFLLLVYAFLEWLLISLLLTNSLFSYFISKFASFFGLQKPCLFCSRLDHFLDNKPNTLLHYSDHLCHSHASEISLLRYCHTHRRLENDNDNTGFAKCCCFCGSERFGRFGEDDCLSSSSSMFICYEKEAMEDSKAGSNGSGEFGAVMMMVSDGSIVQCRDEEEKDEGLVGFEGCDLRLIPVEVIDSSTRADMGGFSGDLGENLEGFEGEFGLTKSRESEAVLTSEDLYELRINLKKAVMAKLIDLPGTETEKEKAKSLRTQRVDCGSNKDGSETFKASSFVQNDLSKILEFVKFVTSYRDFDENVTLTGTSNEEKAVERVGQTPYFEGILSETKEANDSSEVEQLKKALESEQKAIMALYKELEEERSASAIAANQTMAMITRLQEEKAAMQMEALQYQRMMEEQSEYDQEALQLLNDLMIKREKEKQELERELEACRKKILDYEEREKIQTIRRLRDSSASCSHGCDSDDTSIDLNREFRDNDCVSDSNNDETVVNLEEIAMDCVKHMSVLDESLMEFEEERLSILDQLKTLEEKLVKLGDEDGEFAQDLKQIAMASRPEDEDLEESPAIGSTCQSSKDENDTSEKKQSSVAKNLLPFFDTEDGGIEGVGDGLLKNDVEGNKVAIEEEVDHVYERLQALEADREFLKNCMSSIKKGDKGMDLLQEILQHLRHLKNIELRMRNTNEYDNALEHEPVGVVS